MTIELTAPGDGLESYDGEPLRVRMIKWFCDADTLVQRAFDDGTQVTCIWYRMNLLATIGTLEKMGWDVEGLTVSETWDVATESVETLVME